MLTAQDLIVPTLGPAGFDSPFRPLIEQRERERSSPGISDRLLLYDTLDAAAVIRQATELGDVPSFEVAGAHPLLFFDPVQTRAGIVTCGGLCPGLNDVIRGLVMVLHYRYGCTQVEGYRFGYEGLNPALGHMPMVLTPERVSHIHEDGGTILGSSRGPQPPEVCVDFLQSRSVNILFTIGGDGTQRGALAISNAAQRRGYPLAVVGVPKTIDNDIRFVEQSFGFQTAFTQAVEAIKASHTEAVGSRRGVGLVKLMGRHSGFIAAYAAIACNQVNVVLIPEVAFPLEGPMNLLNHLEDRLARRGHAVVVVAEGAGQEYVSTKGADASGNRKLGDIGLFLRDKLVEHFSGIGQPINLKYLDPSYVLRGVPATPHDSVLCFRLAAYAVHAAMTGRTAMLVGKWHGKYLNLPIAVAVAERQCVDPLGDLWQSVLEATGQPRWGDTSDGEPSTQEVNRSSFRR